MIPDPRSACSLAGCDGSRRRAFDADVFRATVKQALAAIRMLSIVSSGSELLGSAVHCIRDVQKVATIGARAAVCEIRFRLKTDSDECHESEDFGTVDRPSGCTRANVRNGQSPSRNFN